MRDYIKLGREDILRIISKSNVCVLSLCNERIPYSVPMCYSSYIKGEKLYLKMKSPTVGKKMLMLDKNKLVSILIEYGFYNCNRTIIISGFARVKDNDILIEVVEMSGRRYI